MTTIYELHFTNYFLGGGYVRAFTTAEQAKAIALTDEEIERASIVTVEYTVNDGEILMKRDAGVPVKDSHYNAKVVHFENIIKHIEAEIEADKAKTSKAAAKRIKDNMRMLEEEKTYLAHFIDKYN